MATRWSIRKNPWAAWSREIADPKLELERYHSAVETFCHVTQVKADRVAEMAGKERGDIIRCQADMIRDPYLNGQVEGRIASGQSAEAALSASCDLFIDLFTAAEDEVTRQRGRRCAGFAGRDAPPAAGPAEMDFSALQPGTVLLAEELSPSAVSVLNSANVAGIVLGKGGPTSHSAIFGPGPGNPRRAGPGGPGAGRRHRRDPDCGRATGAAWCSPPAR